MVATALVTGVLAALVLGLVLQPVVLRAMTAASVIDRPCERSSHTVPTPRGGGVAVAAAAAAGLLVAGAPAGVVAALVLFAAIGLVEDLRGLPVATRLVLQGGAGALAGVLLVPGGLAGPLAGPGAGGLAGPVAGPVAVLLVLVVAVWLAGYANAFNFMDGLNGISAVHAGLAGVVYLVVGLGYGAPELAAAGAVTAAAAATFLPWNAGRARIFLGDVGSYGLGGLLGAVATYALLLGVPVEAVLAPLALYLADTGWTLARRWYQGEVWYRAHRSHAYQRLAGLGWSHQRVTAVTAAVSATVCAVGLAAADSGLGTRIALDALAVAILAGYLAAPALLAVAYRPAHAVVRRSHA